MLGIQSDTQVSVFLDTAGYIPILSLPGGELRMPSQLQVALTALVERTCCFLIDVGE